MNNENSHTNIIQKEEEKSGDDIQRIILIDEIDNENQSNKKPAQNSLRQKKSSKTLLEYFNDDKTDEGKKFSQNERYFYYRHKVQFSLKHYIEFFLIHLASVILGPFIFLYRLFFWKNKKLLSNTMLLGNNRFFYILVIHWFSTLSICYMFFFDEENKYILGDSIDLIVLIFANLIKCASIAGKYSTYPEGKIRKVKEVPLTFEDVDSETMFSGWIHQKEKTVDNEIYDSLLRGEIEVNLFKISFMKKINLDVKKEFKSIAEKFGVDEYEFESEISEGKNQKKLLYYDAALIFRFIVERFRDKSKSMIKRYKIFGVFTTIFYGFMASGLRLMYSKPIIGINWLEIITYIFNIYFVGMMSYVLVTFNAIAKIDIKRKLFSMRQLGQLISPKRREDYSKEKLLPTINIMDPMSLKCWVKLRYLVLDYGKRYFIRHEVLLPFFLITGFGSITAAFVILYLNKGEFTGDFKTSSEIVRVSTFLDFNFIFLFSLFMILLYQAAMINKEFDSHIKILSENGQVYQDLYNFRDLYFEELRDKNEKRRCVQIFKLEKREVAACFLKQSLVNEIRRILGDYVEDFVEEYLENLIKVNQECIDELEREKRFNSLKMLGFHISTKGANNLMVAFISIVVTSYEIFNPN